MRICFIGALELNHFQRLIKWFTSRGHDVHVITFDTYVPPNFTLDNIHIHEIRAFYPLFTRIFPKKSIWFKIWAIRKIIRKISPDIVHGYFLTEFGFYTAFSGNHPTILTLTGSDVYINWRSSKIIELINKISLRKINVVISLSDHMTKELISTFKVNGQKIITRPEGIDLKVFNHYSKKQIENTNTVISTRNLKPIYNVDLLIRAIPLVLNEFPQLKFIIAGDGGEKSRLQQLASQFNISSNVHFIGSINHYEIPQWLRNSNIYVSTSISDGASISLFEAMACGCFPIVTDIPANREWINDGKNGFLAPLNNPKVLADKIILAIMNNELRRRARTINWQIVETKVDMEKNMKIIEDKYSYLIAEGDT